MISRRRRNYGRRRKDAPIVDFFGNVIEIGDPFFFGNPCVLGRVIKKRESSIMLETGADRSGRSTTMNCKDPAKGICLNKIPEDVHDE